MSLVHACFLPFTTQEHLVLTWVEQYLLQENDDKTTLGTRAGYDKTRIEGQITPENGVRD